MVLLILVFVVWNFFSWVINGNIMVSGLLFVVWIRVCSCICRMLGLFKLIWIVCYFKVGLGLFCGFI